MIDLISTLCCIIAITLASATIVSIIALVVWIVAGVIKDILYR